MKKYKVKMTFEEISSENNDYLTEVKYKNDYNATFDMPIKMDDIVADRIVYKGHRYVNKSGDVDVIYFINDEDYNFISAFRENDKRIISELLMEIEELEDCIDYLEEPWWKKIIIKIRKMINGRNENKKEW